MGPSAAPPVAGASHPVLRDNDGKDGSTKEFASYTTGIFALGKTTKPKWTAKRTRGQFTPFSYSVSSQPTHLDKRQPELANVVGNLAITVGHVGSAVLPSARTSPECYQAAAAKQGGGASEVVTVTPELLPRLPANGTPLSPPNLTPATVTREVTMEDEITYSPQVADATSVTKLSVDSVPRSFEYVDLTLPSEESVEDMTAPPATSGIEFADNDVQLPVLAPGQPISAQQGQQHVPTLTKAEAPSTPIPSRPPPVFTTGPSQAHEVIYIDSTDDESCSPMGGLILEETSPEIPTTEPKVSSVEEAWTPKIAVILDSRDRVIEDGSSEEDVPLSVLRRMRRNKRRLIDEETEFSIVNKATAVSMPSASSKQRRKTFDSDAFDAMIYSQSQMRPPRGVKLPRPATASSTVPQDEVIYVTANPAIHRPVVRSDQWWKDKAREIRSRPNRKRWFGKAAERMRWLQNKQQQEERRRRPQTRGSVGRTPRRDPQPAGYNRVMDFGDVPEHQLPLEVLKNPAWVKACEWMRGTRKNEEAIARAVEHSTQMVWKQYQILLNEDNNSNS